MDTHKNIYTLGINEALCASAALSCDGRIVAAAAEERFTRIKNQWGFPKESIRYCLKEANITPADIDCVVLSYIDPYPHFVEKRGQEKKDFAPGFLKHLRNVAPNLEYQFPWSTRMFDAGRRLYYAMYQTRNQKQQEEEIARFLKIRKEKIIRVHHHLCHAYTAYFSDPNRGPEDTLVLTNDGAGDQISASVFLVRDGTCTLITHTPHSHSLGLLYAAITSHLGLKAHEDEYKVMGLAPYATNADLKKIVAVLKKLLWVDHLEFKTSLPSRHYGNFIREHLASIRFDHLAAATQIFFEDILVQWVKNAVSETHVTSLAVSGGVFLNVKANLEIAKLPPIKTIFFMPSPGDDSNAIGAAYYGYTKIAQNNPEPLSTLYLGPHYTKEEIRKALQNFPSLKVQKLGNAAASVAKLLSAGNVVARFAGRMEFGARALGNRSILADPRNTSVVETINKMIKMRDFWMPFAPTVLDESAHKYLTYPRRIDASYMILAFETTPRGQKDLAAAIHPYDKSARPQVLRRQDNPIYYQIIQEFEKLTGVGALLNTSFNIHGEPIVCTPHDALSTFVRSGLTYMILEDLLVTKL